MSEKRKANTESAYFLTFTVVLYNNEIFNQKVDYIHNNPVKNGCVTNAENYTFSSANTESNFKVDEW